MTDPGAAQAALQVEFEIAVLCRCDLDCLEGCRRQRRPTQAGVQDDPGGVDDGPQACRFAGDQRRLQPRHDERHEEGAIILVLVSRRQVGAWIFTGEQSASELFDHLPDLRHDVGAVASAQHLSQRFEVQNLVDRWE